jgi:hypothetical protein
MAAPLVGPQPSARCGLPSVIVSFSFYKPPIGTLRRRLARGQAKAFLVNEILIAGEKAQIFFASTRISLD